MNSYTDNLRKIKSLLIVTSLQKKIDIKAFKNLEKLKINLDWNSKSNLMIDEDIWDYIVKTRKYDPKLVFCHPSVIVEQPTSSLYYRCLTGLSIKAAKEYIGSIENIEIGSIRAKVSQDKALKMARVYNTFICSIIKGSFDWTLENGKRTIIATLGITIDGVMRNKVGSLAEDRIRNMVFDWLLSKDMIISPSKKEIDELQDLPVTSYLIENIIMRFSAEPDISFSRKDKVNKEELLAIIEIKGGIDPAGALERYGAATKSFQHALSMNPKCKNIFLSAVYTSELKKRIQKDRLVENYYDIIEILEEPKKREDFFKELFHYTLRILK
ncbi:MAG: XcyI family restriction endonuclease [Bacteroidales bacterium]|nr:XcyI family restriction endonuclease [Bacteroidales bacterium]